MIFYVILAITLAGVVYGFVWSFREGMGDTWIGCTLFGLLTGFLSTAVGALVGFGLISLLYWTTTDLELRGQEDETLRAVSASSSVEGRFFLGSGYVDGVRTLNYIVAEDGYSELRQARADDSRIYEDETAQPYVTTYYWEREAWWLTPFSVGQGTSYDFHIPPASILEDFTIDNANG